ncbi:MAG TPA: PadR family transcriptional regulator [Candidatus Binatus sp.]|nr:PadR family transcriptional regulator [Candidatus Binatus sp.]
MNDLILLAILADSPQHGYALKKRAGIALGQPDMHNNLVYPLLRRFMSQKWVTQRKTAGQRGQTRQVYSLTLLGRAALVNRLQQFDDASSAEAFRLRIGLFELLNPAAREEILSAREKYLESREKRLALLQTGVDLGRYGSEVTKFMRQQNRAELSWISRLRRMNRAR